MSRPLTIQEVGRLFGLSLPRAPGKVKCPFRKHLRRPANDKQFRIYRSRKTGDELQFCWSCDRDANNPGDAVSFYARMTGLDRKAAFRKLREEGFDMPGGNRGAPGEQTDAERRAYEEQQKKSVHAIPVAGAQPERVLPLNLAQWEKWRTFSAGALAKFAELRGIPEPFLREHGMVELPGGYVGFTYFDPITRAPCRVKVRSVEKGAWWVEPRSKDDPGAKAAAPLYLVHELRKLQVGPKDPLIIVEGEIDALSLLYAGILNVVSLPDGAESVKSVDLSPIVRRFAPWLAAMDDDKTGDRSFGDLQSFRSLQGRASETPVVRVKWRRLLMDGGTEELQTFKDANDALRGGFTRGDFLTCLELASAGKFAGRLPWRLAG